MGFELLEDLQNWYKDEHYPPDGPDLDYELVDSQWQNKGTQTEQVSRKVIDDSPRWGDVIEIVYRRESEYVAVHDIAPATESQDWGDYGPPEIFRVEPVEVTVTEYRKV